jgi:GNAT superfamily N-acetyltransferase
MEDKRVDLVTLAKQVVERGCQELNRDRVGQDDGRLFAFFLRDERQEIVAGISGWTWAQACEIRQLWVHPSLQGRGHGRALLDSAEGEARGRGCRVILLSTYSFQAPGFYRKCGFELGWELSDFPPGHRYCVMVKRLDEAGTP